MAKNRNTFAKRSRETEKKRKAQDKADRRKERKDRPPTEQPVDGVPREVIEDDDDDSDRVP